MKRKELSVSLVLLLLLSSFIVIDVTLDIIPRVTAKTIYVDDDYSSENETHKMTIRAGVDAADPGDTVYVYNGEYYEYVPVDKTINLIGEDRNSTIIDGGGGSHGIYITTNWTNITGFRIIGGRVGIELINSNWNNIIGNSVLNQVNGYAINLRGSCGNNIIGNSCLNDNLGIGLGTPGSCENNTISNNNVSNNYYGIAVYQAKNNNITSNIIFNNVRGFEIAADSSNTIIRDNIVLDNEYGFYLDSSRESYIINCSLSSSNRDFYFYENAHAIALNTTFNKSKTYFSDTASTLTVNWFLHVNATDYLGNMAPNAIVCIKDSKNSLPPQKYKTDPNGYVRWIVETEYIENYYGKIYHTPHKITAWNKTLLGNIDVNIDESKEVNVVLDIPYYEIPLHKGWNLISLPLIQSDTSITSVLSSIDGNYNKIMWYNASKGKWHSNDGDLTNLDHTMGFYIHMKNDDTLIVVGDIPNSTYIQLYKGWNLVGNPTFCIHSINEIFMSISGNYTAIQWYDASDTYDHWKHYNINKPQDLNDLTYITCGRGYWVYVKEECVWDVNNF
jgi:parallel beta-helix repeat protein